MFDANDSYIDRAMRELPDPCSIKDLIKFGYFKSEQQACYRRRVGISPEYLKMGNGRVYYCKSAIIKDLQRARRKRGSKFADKISVQLAVTDKDSL